MRALLLTLALVSMAAAQSAPAPTVAVTDENGVAVSSARVVLQLPPLPAIRCQTDFIGRCRFPSLPVGQYLLRVEKEGFYALLEPIKITPGSIIEVAISHQQEVREIVDVHESPPAIAPAQVAPKKTSRASTSSTSCIPALKTIATSSTSFPAWSRINSASRTSPEPRLTRPSPCSTVSTSRNPPTDNFWSASARMPSVPFRSSPRASRPKRAKDPADCSASTPKSATTTPASPEPILSPHCKTSTDCASTSSCRASPSPAPSKKER